jgi:hypothetical protein
LELLEKANAWFDDAKYPRLTLYFELKMAKLHEYCCNYEKAIHCYNNVANIYRVEKWPVLLKSVLHSLIGSARKGNQPKILVSTLLELLSQQLKPDLEEDLASLFKELFEMIYKENHLNHLRQVVMIETNQTPSFLECFAQMYQNHVIASDPVRFQFSIYPALRLSFPFTFTPARIYVEFSNSIYNFAILHDGSVSQNVKTSTLLDIPNATKVLFSKLTSGIVKSIPKVGDPAEHHNALTYVANLCFTSDMASVYEADFTSDVPEEIYLKNVVCIFESPSWTIGLLFPTECLSRYFDQQRWFSLSENNHHFSHLERHLQPTNIR